MDSKLAILIDKLKLNYFEDGRLLKIIGNNDHSEYTFYMELKNSLPVNIYDELYNNLVSYYKDLHISLNVKLSNKDNDLIIPYFKYFIERYSKNCPMLTLFLSDKIEIKDNLLIIYVTSKNEVDKFNSIVDNLKKSFFNAGYELEFKAVIDEKLENELKKEIEDNI